MRRIHVYCLLLTILFAPAIAQGEKNTMELFYKNLPVLVTGGCGFIGSHIVTELVSLGANVTILDNLSTGSLANIEHVKNKVTVIQKSITDKNACIEAAHGKKVIFHLAAFISVPQSMEQPYLCHEINVDGTVNMLEAARINSVERFVFSSSAAVYGFANGTCSEQTPTDPQSPYGFSKLIGEYYCKQYALNFGIKTAILRYFNVWGERQNPNGSYAAVVAKFMDQMKHNAPITIFGDGKQTRDFVPVRKVAHANLILSMLAPANAGQIFNIGTGTSITLLELIDQLKKQFPSYTGDIIFAPTRSGDLKYSAANCSKYYSLVQNQ